MSHLKRPLIYLTLLLLGGGLLAPLVSYATLTLDSTSLTSDGALTVKSASSSITLIGETNQTGAITVASSSETLTLNLGTGTGATTVNIATGATNAKTVNIATAASLLHVITLGTASTTISVPASTTFGGSLGLSSLTTNSPIYLNSSGVVTALASSTAGKVLTATSTAPYFSWETAASIPSGFVGFFNLSSCPSGWTEDTNSRGRYIVGLPSGGSLASTTGTALTDKEDRATGQHGHGVTDPGHTHTAAFYQDGGGTNPGRFSAYGTSSSSGNYPVNASGTGISINTTGTTAGTNAPYIQYLACQKS